MKLFTVVAIAAFAIACTPCAYGPEPVGEAEGVQFYCMSVERLPSLNTPRGGEHVMLAGGELTVFGGHSDGYAPLASAEYLKGGAWHEVPMKYPHYYGFTVRLPDGTVMLGGGTPEPFGIGQSWGVEIYDPENHSFKGIGILNRARAGVSALPLDDGRVLVSGNWQAEDAIEIYSPGEGFSFLKATAEQRAYPIMLQSGPGQAIIFGNLGSDGGQDCNMVDRLQGDAFYEPLLDEWTTVPSVSVTDRAQLQTGDYSYLIGAQHKSDGRPGVLCVNGEDFSVLETNAPIPLYAPGGEKIIWDNNLQLDRSEGAAWLQGWDTTGRFYTARVDYGLASGNGGKAPVRVFVAWLKDGPLPLNIALLLSGGRLALIGSHAHADTKEWDTINFEAYGDAFILHTRPFRKGLSPWWYVLATLSLCSIIVLLARALHRSRRSAEKSGAAPEAGQPSAQLTERLIKLIEEEELFRNPDLRLADVAEKLATNKTYASALFNSYSGTGFTDLINGYRVRYAQKLMRENPYMPVAEVAHESGFSSQSSFYRNFKALTGLTPSEWKGQ